MTTSSLTIRPSRDRGSTDHGWLKSYHTFSFADYFDPKHTAFRTLRVINEDWVQPGQGFGTHPHRDMEIITVILEGTLAHNDSMGNTSTIHPGEIQRMSAGTGVTHSEFNASDKEKVHLLQIWILPEKKGLAPSYEQKNFPAEEKKNNLKLVASKSGAKGSVTIHQDAELFDCDLESKKEVAYTLKKGRGAWVQVKSGRLNLNGLSLHEGDGASVENESRLQIQAEKNSSFLLFDLL